MDIRRTKDGTIGAPSWSCIESFSVISVSLFTVFTMRLAANPNVMPNATLTIVSHYISGTKAVLQFYLTKVASRELLILSRS